jgi:RimJ/RimL family protein N-acetyltransferase
MSEDLMTARLRLRRWKSSDREPFRQINSDLRVTELLAGALSHDQSDEMIGRLERHFEQHGFGMYAVELRESSRLIGALGLYTPTFEAPFLPAVEIAWRLAAANWGQGLATEGAREVVRHAFEEIHLKELVAFTVPANVRSWRVMERIGMTRDPGCDFEHPVFPPGHALRPHLLYRLSRTDWLASR